MIQDEAGQRSLNFQSYKERITNFSNEFELGLFIHIVRRSLLWIILVMLLALASAFIYLRYTAPTYSTRSILQLRESNTAQQILNVETFVEDKNLQADVELMRSPFFVGKALDRLDLAVSYFNRGQILTEEYYTRSFFKIKEISVYNDRVRDIPIAVDLSNPTRVTLSYTVGGKVQEFSFAAMEIIRTPDLSCILEVSENHVSQNDGDERSLYFKINSRKALINQYLSQIQVRIADNNAQTVEISCMDENPYLARDLAQAMAETFIDYDVERKTESAANIIRFIRAQKDTVFEQLRGSEYELQQFKVDNKVTGLGQLTPMYIEQSELYENELVKIEQDIALLTEIQRATDRPLPEISVYDLMPLLVGTEYQQTLASMIRTMEDLLRERDAIYLDATREHQSVRSLEYQIDLQKQLILASITSIRDRALVRKKELLTTLSEIDRKFLALPEKELRYARIERLFNINEKYYTQLLEKDVEYRISKAGFVPENQILEDAGPTSGTRSTHSGTWSSSPTYWQALSSA
jgi:tyrosine-protein kinase Etk/Wzc